VIAIDWSGQSGPGQKRVIWLAEVTGGHLTRLENGRTRNDVVDHLVAQKHRDPKLVVGIDFAFSLPAWYLQHRRLSERALWTVIADEALTPAMRRYGPGAMDERPGVPVLDNRPGARSSGTRPGVSAD
jgi:hypothetical protein